jgi:hypothetical protein
MSRDVILKLLDWPFLLFLVAIIMFVLFRTQLGRLFSAGDIQITWGNTTIKLNQLSDRISREIDPAEDEIEAIKVKIERLEARLSSPGVPEHASVEELKPSEVVSNDTNPTRRIHEALSSGKYLWRSVERLAVIGGVSEIDTIAILRADPDVVLSKGKSGKSIARLKVRAA